MAKKRSKPSKKIIPKERKGDEAKQDQKPSAGVKAKNTQTKGNARSSKKAGKPPRKTISPSAIVAIGCGAGGIDAMKPFFESVMGDTGVAFIVAQRIDAGESYLLTNVIQRLTPLPVQSLTEFPTSPTANCVYVLPERSVFQIVGSGIAAVEEPDTKKRADIVDVLFQSLSEQFEIPLIGIVLSGEGNDGTLGLQAISNSGGMTIAQESQSANNPEMPQSAATSGSADHTLRPEKMAKLIVEFVSQLAKRNKSNIEEILFNKISSLLPRICDTLLKVTEHDFRHYKENTLLRRISRRMLILRIDSADDYLKLLQADREEAHSLFRELLISVTAFFRDPDTFAALANYVLPKIAEERLSEDGTIRIWVPGCASGQEAYTLAMMMMEELDKHPNTKLDFTIFATDIDQRALNVARQGSYPASVSDEISQQRIDRFFTTSGNHLTVKKEIREKCVFSVHNLVSDPPFSQMDLISCRNLLIYLGQPLQIKLVPMFHFALRSDGFLLLGPSENLASHTEIFKSVDSKHRISQRKPGPARTRPQFSSDSRLRGHRLVSSINSPNEMDIHQITQRIALDEFTPRYCVVNEDATVVCTSTGLEQYLEFPDGPFQNNIVKMAKRGLRSVLRSSLNEAKKTLRTVVRSDVFMHTEEMGRIRLKLTVQPMPELGENLNLFMVVFKDLEESVSRVANGDKVSATDAEAMIEQLETELEQTRAQLEDSIQEVEGSNEELKSSNEELRSINEELQSSNEELETSKEEIQAGMEALARAKSDLQNLLDGTQIATVFLDDELCIRGFTPAISRIYRLEEVDIGRSINLFVPEVDDMPPLPEPSSVDSQVADTVVSRTGKSYIRRVLPYWTQDRAREGIVVTFADVTELKQREDELASAKARLDIAMQVAEVAAWSWDMEAGDVIADRNLRRMFGFNEDEKVTVESFTSRISQPFRAQVESAIKRALNDGGAFDEEYSIILPSGETRWIRGRGEAPMSENGSVGNFYGLVVDITERKNWELKLSEDAERLQLAAHAAKFASYDINLIDDSIIWTPELAEILGQSMESLAKAKASQMVEFLHEEDREGWQTSFYDSHQPDGSGLVECEFRIRDLEGNIRWVLGRGQTIFEDGDTDRLPTRAVGVLMDIDSRKQAEFELVESESQRNQTAMRLSLALSAGGMAAWEWSPTESFWTDEHYELLGIPPQQELTTNTVLECVHPSDRARVQNELRDAIQKEIPFRTSFKIVRLGELRWLDSAGEVLKDNTGKVSKICGLNWDTTAERRTKQALEESERKAQQASIAKTEFLANMSHEIRTPMSAIMGYADILAQYLKDPDNLNCVQIIQQNGRFLLEIINDILDISKIEAGKLELLTMPFRIDQLLADVKSLMEVRTAEKDLRFSIDVHGKIPQEITSDSKRLKQILFNLIGNAIKFTESGSVKLSISMLDSAGNDAIAGDPRIKFDIEDSGIGISESQLKRLFQPFMQGDPSVDRKYGGTGLGLAISRRLAEMLGGEVAVTSELGVGSTFSFTISTGSLDGVEMVDANEFEVAGILKLDDAPQRKPTLSGKILVVDDRREIRFIAQHFVADAGGRVVTGENGQQAIDLIAEAESAGKPFDLLVIDMQMPVLDGYEATRRLRASGFSKPIVALTAHAMEGDRKKCLESGCTDYFAKPLDGPKFIALLDRYLNGETSADSERKQQEPLPNESESEIPVLQAKDGTTGKHKILLVDDNRNACEAVGVLLELNGHQISHAYDGKSAIETATLELPDFVMLDLGLPDISGEEVIATLKTIPELAGTMVIAMTGREDSPELRSAGFDDYIQKPINVNNVEQMLKRLSDSD